MKATPWENAHRGFEVDTLTTVSHQMAAPIRLKVLMKTKQYRVFRLQIRGAIIFIEQCDQMMPSMPPETETRKTDANV